MYSSVNLHSKTPFSEYTKDLIERIYSEIHQKPKEYIIGVSEKEFKDYLEEKFFLKPIEILKETETREKPYNIIIERYERIYQTINKIDGYECRVNYMFEGNPQLFWLIPTTRNTRKCEYLVDWGEQKVGVSFELENLNADEYEKLLLEKYRDAFSEIPYINNNANSWNLSLRKIIDENFDQLKTRLLNENKFFEEINVKVDKKTVGIYNASPIKRKEIPQAPKNYKSFKNIPTFSEDMYWDILNILHIQGQSMERKPSTYLDKDEEGIRDYFITLLETRYENTTTTSETFNKNGKTDILVKYQDGTNIFIGECKWWKGKEEYKKAINQLFDNYITWRDTKVALLLFVKTKEISNVLNKVFEGSQEHLYFVKDLGNPENGRYSFLFHLPDDKNSFVFLEVLIFHFNNK